MSSIGNPLAGTFASSGSALSQLTQIPTNASATGSGFLQSPPSQKKLFDEIAIQALGPDGFVASNTKAAGLARAALADVQQKQSPTDYDKTLADLNKDPVKRGQFFLNALEQAPDVQALKDKFMGIENQVKASNGGQGFTLTQLRQKFIEMVQVAQQGGNVDPLALIALYSRVQDKQNIFDQFRQRLGDGLTQSGQDDLDKDAIQKLIDDRKAKQDAENKNDSDGEGEE